MQSAEILQVESVDGLDIPTMIDGEKISPGKSLSVTFIEDAAACLVAGRPY